MSDGMYSYLIIGGILIQFLIIDTTRTMMSVDATPWR